MRLFSKKKKATVGQKQQHARYKSIFNNSNNKDVLLFYKEDEQQPDERTVMECSVASETTSVYSKRSNSEVSVSSSSRASTVSSNRYNYRQRNRSSGTYVAGDVSLQQLEDDDVEQRDEKDDSKNKKRNKKKKEKLNETPKQRRSAALKRLMCFNDDLNWRQQQELVKFDMMNNKMTSTEEFSMLQEYSPKQMTENCVIERKYASGPEAYYYTDRAGNKNNDKKMLLMMEQNTITRQPNEVVSTITCPDSANGLSKSELEEHTLVRDNRTCFSSVSEITPTTTSKRQYKSTELEITTPRITTTEMTTEVPKSTPNKIEVPDRPLTNAKSGMSIVSEPPTPADNPPPKTIDTLSRYKQAKEEFQNQQHRRNSPIQNNPIQNKRSNEGNLDAPLELCKTSSNSPLLNVKSLQVIPTLGDYVVVDDEEDDDVKSTQSFEIVDSKQLQDLLVVRPTWTTEDIGTNNTFHDDPNLNGNRSVATTESIAMKNCENFTQVVTRSVWNNCVLVPSNGNQKQQQLLLPNTAEQRDPPPASKSVTDLLVVRPTWTLEEIGANDRFQDEPNLNESRSIVTTESMVMNNCEKITNEVTQSLWMNFLSAPKSDNKQKRLLPNDADQRDAAPAFTSVADKDAAAAARVQRAKVSEQERRRESAHVSIVAVDLPCSTSSSTMDNTRNEIAWQRCKARRGTRVVQGGGWSNMRRKSAMKHQGMGINDVRTPNQQHMSTIVEEAMQDQAAERRKRKDLIEQRKMEISTPPSSSSHLYRAQIALSAALPVGTSANFCTGPMVVGETGSDSEDSSIRNALNPKLRRTSSPVPFCKSNSYSCTSQDEDDDEDEEDFEHYYRRQANRHTEEPKSWIQYWFSGSDTKDWVEDNESTVYEDSTLEDGSRLTNEEDDEDYFNGEDDEDDGDVESPRQEQLLQQAESFGWSLSHLLEAAVNSSSSKKKLKATAIPQLVPIIVYQQDNDSEEITSFGEPKTAMNRTPQQMLKEPTRMSLAL